MSEADAQRAAAELLARFGLRGTPTAEDAGDPPTRPDAGETGAAGAAADQADAVTATPAPRTRYHHGNLRPTLIAAAAALIEEGGLERLSLRAAARRAGVSHNAPYHHFADKAALVAAVTEDGLLRLRDALLDAWPDPDVEARAGLRTLTRAYVDFAFDNRAIYRLMWRPELRAPSDAVDRAALGVVSVVERAVSRVLDRNDPEDADLDLDAIAVWGALTGMTASLLDGPLADAARDEARALVVDVVARITRPRIRPMAGEFQQAVASVIDTSVR